LKNRDSPVQIRLTPPEKSKGLLVSATLFLSSWKEIPHKSKADWAKLTYFKYPLGLGPYESF
jgi:hypothetical protein